VLIPQLDASVNHRVNHDAAGKWLVGIFDDFVFFPEVLFDRTEIAGGRKDEGKANGG
jgi:hypothetical protein